MFANTEHKGITIFVSVIFRRAALAWPSIAGIVYGAIDLNKPYGYRMDFEFLAQCRVAVYTWVVFQILCIMVVAPCFGNRTSIASILILDLLSFGANIAYFVVGSGSEFIPFVDLFVPGLLLYITTMVLLVVFSGVPAIKRDGFMGLPKRRKFLYGCLFLSPG
ncbi:hypothetical protein Cantr_00764 [Candida viswanathii]|uniref:Uncharacterized protein n=1 Tax=Candida viswanathii TaxID=5486 RepID=A0A367YGP8_9ASCO|nr:hypothetical protein Cantr_00764 [Candida viswanathii]